jgi:hypothetical protein
LLLLLLLLQGNWDCAKKILRNHGLRGIYSGYLSTLLRDMQGYAWFFFGYEATVHYLAGPGKTKADLEYWQVGVKQLRFRPGCSALILNQVISRETGIPVLCRSAAESLTTSVMCMLSRQFACDRFACCA